jgi:hypothetical protein
MSCILLEMICFEVRFLDEAVVRILTAEVLLLVYLLFS